MIGVLILSLSILLCGALPWWPYTASARSRHHRPWDWLMDSGAVTGEKDEQDHVPEVATTLRSGEPPEAAFVPGGQAGVATRHTVAAGAGRDLLVA